MNIKHAYILKLKDMVAKAFTKEKNHETVLTYAFQFFLCCQVVKGKNFCFCYILP